MTLEQSNAIGNAILIAGGIATLAHAGLGLFFSRIQVKDLETGSMGPGFNSWLHYLASAGASFYAWTVCGYVVIR